MASKARELANLGNAYSDGALSNRNLIINGAMQVAQRGTSATGVGSGSGGYKTVDRFEISTNMGACTITQDSTGPDGFANSVKFLVTTAVASPSSGENLGLITRIEGQDLQRLAYGTSSAQSVTLSFWIKTNKTGTYIAEILNSDASNRHIGASVTVNSADTWEYKTVTFPADSSGSIADDNSTAFNIRIWLAAGSQYTSGGSLQTSWGGLSQGNRAYGQVNLMDAVNNYVNITGVQLEVGDTATPFEHEPYSATYNKCLRYYYNTPVLRGGSNNPVAYTGNYVELQGTRHRFADVLGYRSQTAFHPVVMRATPTITLYNPNNSGTSGQWQLYNYDSATQNFGGFVGGGRATMFYLAGYTGVTVGGAGLSLISNCHWEADAEL